MHCNSVGQNGRTEGMNAIICACGISGEAVLMHLQVDLPVPSAAVLIKQTHAWHPQRKHIAFLQA